MIEFCDRCGGKIVRTRDAALCGCGAFGTRKVAAVIVSDVRKGFRREQAEMSEAKGSKAQ